MVRMQLFAGQQHQLSQRCVKDRPPLSPRISEADLKKLLLHHIDVFEYVRQLDDATIKQQLECLIAITECVAKHKRFIHKLENMSDTWYQIRQSIIANIQENCETVFSNYHCLDENIKSNEMTKNIFHMGILQGEITMYFMEFDKK